MEKHKRLIAPIGLVILGIVWALLTVGTIGEFRYQPPLVPIAVVGSAAFFAGAVVFALRKR